MAYVLHNLESLNDKVYLTGVKVKIFQLLTILWVVLGCLSVQAKPASCKDHVLSLHYVTEGFKNTLTYSKYNKNIRVYVLARPNTLKNAAGQKRISLNYVESGSLYFDLIKIEGPLYLIKKFFATPFAQRNIYWVGLNKNTQAFEDAHAFNKMLEQADEIVGVAEAIEGR